MKQVRIPIPEVSSVMNSVSNATTTWEEILAKYPEQNASEE